MSKILNTKTLIILLVVLVGVYFLSKLFEKEDRTFKSQLVTVDTAKVTAIEIVPKAGSGEENIMLRRTGTGWTLESGGSSYNPDPMAARNVLSELVNLKPERVAAKDESRWDELQVTDSTGTRVKLFRDKKEVADVYIGKFNYTQPPQTQPGFQQQNRGKMSTHVRLAGEDEVYVVDGFIKMNIQTDVSNYRNKNVVMVNSPDVTKVSFKYPGENFTLTKEENVWMVNGLKADSAKTAQYVNSLRRVTGADFVDDPEVTTGKASHVVTIEGNNILPVEVKAHPADTVHNYIITSSTNPGTRFSDAKSTIFEKVFRERSYFVPGLEGQK